MVPYLLSLCPTSRLPLSHLEHERVDVALLHSQLVQALINPFQVLLDANQVLSCDRLDTYSFEPPFQGLLLSSFLFDCCLTHYQLCAP
ncbi:MAG: hypothetical protein KVP17_002225 [Porospora cf. gigantea B]|uniref:uncharacterized protein n=1 Tax=Porospora cf. gigantea B TaxID=2853592 RepID=UPI0035718F66|nr:MAG: hypothetical protein KVP17_002225 [Porospora cf. gigantea B]